jgi:alkanesulfonate monooxygenase SsuD/methylene tetrahydromethanopterin reductase-like flavin-dependent oxidoreductase (luciferase family)
MTSGSEIDDSNIANNPSIRGCELSRIEFGLKTAQGGYSYEELVKLWSAAEELGYDSAWLYDHFYALGDPTKPCLEAWTTLAALASVTTRIKIGQWSRA